MTYDETVAYLYRLLPDYQRTGRAAGKIDLSKTLALLAAMGNPHHRLRVVHVGGTNGKGTVSHLLASFATASGLRAGLYTSPHYVDFRERIRIDGAEIGRDRVVAFAAEHRSLIERVRASFFEFTVAMAFAHFAAEQVDLAVIEVGLGGRLDSTNVIDPLLSVITNVDLDHTEVLGDTRAAIAREKAGIIKPGRPVVIGRFQEETWPVFRTVAAEREAPMYKSWRYPEARLRDVKWAALSMQGPFAAENARTALAAYEVLRKQTPLPEPRYSALERMDHWSGYGGRYAEVSTGGPRVVVDAGHNLAAWEQVVPAVVSEASAKTCHVVCGFVRGKAPLSFARLWPASTRFYVGDMPALPRNKPRAQTIAELAAGGIDAADFASIPEAFAAAQQEAASDETVFVGGSSFVVGDFYEATSRKPA